MSEPDTPRPAAAAAAAETAARRSYGKLVAYLASRTRDLAAAQDALASAFESALRRWPIDGVPRSAEAWLMTAAKRALIDAARRERTRGDAADALALLAALAQSDADEAQDNAADPARWLPDDRLVLMFACAHPAIEPAARAPLMLQTILGFDAGAIASAFLVAPATMGQRLVRAKAKIKQAGIPFRLPGHDEWHGRVNAVCDAIYAAYTEGWSDAAGTDARRRNLADEGIWLGRLLAMLMPDEPETLGLLALMLHAQARRGARRDAAGEYVPLDQQDPARWDAALIDEAEALLHRAASREHGIRFGRYQLEAAVQSAHAHRRISGKTDWAAIERLYAALAGLTGSPVVALNHAVALARAQGAGSGPAALDALDAVNALARDPRLADYQPYWAARAELLARAGRNAEAGAAYQRAIGLEADAAVRRFLQRQLDALPASDR